MTSGSTDFSLTTNSIIEEACELVGVGSEGEAISAYIYKSARRSLNLIVKSWASDHLWLRTEGTVTPVASQANYVLSALFSGKPSRVLSVRRKLTSGGYETPLTEWSRQEYFDQPNKATEAIPVAWYYDPQRDTGTLYLWPTPDSTTASDQTIEVTWLRRIEDFDGSNDNPDLPQEWTRALAYALAGELAIKHGVRPDLRNEIAARAIALKAQIEAWDTEPASLYLQPDWQ